jgi:isopenicillin-N N-acyltransferase-like protein
MRWAANVALLLVLLFVTWLGTVAELGVQLPPPGDPIPAGVPTNGTWFPRMEYGLNHIFLHGHAFERGYAYGYFTRDLLRRQEEALTAKVREIFPSRITQLGLLLLAKRWYWGEDRLLDENWRREMHGVSYSAPGEFNSFADPYTRQLAYHGLHEMGQMFVDFGGDGVNACTVLAVPNGSGWLVGRNLDFEGGRIFDEEKILKWVYPEQGYPFVSVIWAGMVGVVTGVNAKGVYLSINAAGSEQVARFGTPSTLLLLKALQSSASAEEAVEVLRGGSTLITEAFAVADRGPTMYVVEKSPHRTVVRAERGKPVAVTNHLLGKEWAGDKVNDYRRAELTSNERLLRAREIVQAITDRAKKEPAKFRREGASWVAEGLRDKRANGLVLPGNRGAIDALIATHAVVYDSARGILYVGQGPSLTGKFLGYDLAKSFAAERPVPAGEIAEDKLIHPAMYAGIKEGIRRYERVVAGKELRACDDPSLLGGPQHYLQFMALGLTQERCGDRKAAHASWERALALHPAYAREQREAEKHWKETAP